MDESVTILLRNVFTSEENGSYIYISLISHEYVAENKVQSNKLQGITSGR